MGTDSLKNIEDKLDFAFIRSWFEREFLNEETALRPLAAEKETIGAIRSELASTEEFLRALEAGIPISEKGFQVPQSSFASLKKEGYVLRMEELIGLIHLSEAASSISKWIQKKVNDQEFPLLKADLPAVSPTFYREMSILERKVDMEHGQLRPDASKELKDVTLRIAKTEKEFQRAFNEQLRELGARGWLHESGETIFEGERILMVQASYKREAGGIVKGFSGSGNVAYLHTEELIRILYRKSVLHQEKQVEINRVMREISEFLQPKVNEVAEVYGFLRRADRWRAKARFAVKYQCGFPQVSEDGPIELWNARHPALMDSLAKSGRTMVPLNLELKEDARILVISGPNAGGKSVTLKTLGLTWLLLRYGIPAPLSGESKMRMFDRIFVDIGDDQSIEADLSTYSSHLRGLKELLEVAGPGTLFLIDEFGSGTDPALGGPIASTILKRLHDRGSWGVVTTHYSDLKEMAYHTPGMVNAAMSYDKRRLEPGYEVLAGHAGSSFALEICEKTGFDRGLLAEIKSAIGQEKAKNEKDLSGIQHERGFLRNLRKNAQKKDEHLSELIASYESLKRDLEKSRKSLEKQFREDLLQRYNDANRELERRIRESSGAGKEEMKALRKEIDTQRRSLSDELVKEERRSVRKKERAMLKAGDAVVYHLNNRGGVIIEIRGDKAIVDINGMNYSIPLRDLAKVEEPDKAIQAESNRTSEEVLSKSEFDYVLDIRGLYRDEAMAKVEQFLDKAVMYNVEHLRIVHGRGTGALRELVRQCLREYPHKLSYSAEDPQQGGEGVTLVSLEE